MKIHYRAQIEMTPVGQTAIILSDNGPSLRLDDRQSAIQLCELLNDSHIFCILPNTNGSYVGIKKNLRGEFNRLIVKYGLSKPLSISQFETGTIKLREVEFNIAQRYIRIDDTSLYLEPCADLMDLMSQLQR